MVALGKEDVRSIAAMSYFYSLEELLFASLCFRQGSKHSRFENDQHCHHIIVISAHLFFKACVTAMAVCCYHPSQPMAPVTLRLYSRLWLSKSSPPPPPSQKRICVQPDQVHGLPLCIPSWILALMQSGRLIGMVSGLQGWFLPWLVWTTLARYLLLLLHKGDSYALHMRGR